VPPEDIFEQEMSKKSDGCNAAASVSGCAAKVPPAMMKAHVGMPFAGPGRAIRRVDGIPGSAIFGREGQHCDEARAGVAAGQTRSEGDKILTT